MCSLHDTVSFERDGVRAVLLITEPFLGVRDRAAQAVGAVGYPATTLHHPTAIKSASEIAAEAERIVGNVVDSLLGR